MLEPQYLVPNYQHAMYSLESPPRSRREVDERVEEIRHRMSTIDTIVCDKVTKGYFQKLIDINISKLYLSSQIDIPFVAIVTWCCAEGSGDIAFAMKTVNEIHAHFSSATIYVVLRSDDDLIRRMQTKRAYAFCDDASSFTVIKQDEVEKVLSDTRNIGLSTFTFDVATPNCDEAHISLDSISNKHYYHIDEYDGWRVFEQRDEIQKNSDKFTTHYGLIGGVSSFDIIINDTNTDIMPLIGVHINENLTLPSFTGRSDSLQFRAEILSTIRSEKLCSKLSCNTLAESTEYLTNNQLYFAYNSSADVNSGLVYLRRFLATILLHTELYDVSVDFVIVKGAIEVDIEGTLAFLKHIMSSFNIYRDSKFAVYTQIPGSWFWESAKSPKLGKKKRRVRLFFFNKLPHDDMLKIMRASEPPIMVSGDQSLAELISMEGKIPFYQIQGWKTDFIHSIKKLCSKIFPHDAYITSHLQNTFQEEVYEEENPLKLNLERVKYIAKTLQDSRTLAEYKIFHRIIKRYYNINDWLIGEIKRRLHHIETPDTKLSEERILEEIVYDKPMPMMYEKIAQSLNTLAKTIFRRKRKIIVREPYELRSSKRRKTTNE